MPAVLAPRFDIPACAAADVERLRHELGVSGALGQVLVRRGLADPCAARDPAADLAPEDLVLKDAPKPQPKRRRAGAAKRRKHGRSR